MNVDANKIIDTMTKRFSDKIAMLEKENALLSVQLNTLLAEKEEKSNENTDQEIIDQDKSD